MRTVEDSKKIGRSWSRTFAAAASTMRKARGEIWVSHEERKRSSIFFLRARHLSVRLFSDPAKPCFRQVECHPPYRASPYALVREGKVVCHSERHKPSWKGWKSTTGKVPIPVPISFFRLTSVLYVIKKSTSRTASAKWLREGMHLRPGLFSWLLGLKDAISALRAPLYLLLCIFHFQVCVLRSVTLAFSSSTVSKEVSGYLPALHTSSSHITQTIFPVFPTERW